MSSGVIPMPRPALFACVALAVIVAACAHDPNADTSPQPEERAEASLPVPMIAGGYSATDVTGAEIEAARDLAVAEIYRQFPTRALVQKVMAEVQVVAGLNYRFRIQMSGGPGPTYEAVVFRSLQNTMSVSSLKKVK
jgi:hypothetical protein